MTHRVCPWWLGYLLASPVRRLFLNPEKIMKPYVAEGMRVLDVGCGMGFFSLPLARMVGVTGRVVAIDLQERMISGLIRRAGKAKLIDRIDARVCHQDSLQVSDIKSEIDFALVFALAHEVPDKERLFSEISSTMKRAGKLLLVEPKGHVSEKEFEETVSIAKRVGFEFASDLEIRQNRAVLMRLDNRG